MPRSESPSTARFALTERLPSHDDPFARRLAIGTSRFACIMLLSRDRAAPCITPPRDDRPLKSRISMPPRRLVETGPAGSFSTEPFRTRSAFAVEFTDLASSRAEDASPASVDVSVLVRSKLLVNDHSHLPVTPLSVVPRWATFECTSRTSGPSEPSPSRLSLLLVSYRPFNVEETSSSRFPLIRPLTASRSVPGTRVRYPPPARVPSGCLRSRSLSSNGAVLP